MRVNELAHREATDEYLGDPRDAGDGGERCPLDGGAYFESDGVCERCGRTPDFYDRRLVHEPGLLAGRYSVSGIWLDGVERDLARTATLADALDVLDAAEAAYKVAGRADPVLRITDQEDPERGSLDEDSWIDGVDAGPEPRWPR